jgi:ATP-dependent exoDNAse (exonuclease V) beta subunit
MPDQDPIDQLAREAIRTKTAATLFVEAGAGSGKTHELVQRIVGLVAGGVALPRVAAITFTNAAAAELRERVRLELGRAARGEYEEFNEEQRANCAAAHSTIDAASIQTLHSFAQRILALYPIEAGLPARLEMRDDVGSSIAFEERWQPFTEELLKDGRGSEEVATALVHGMMLGLTVKHLRVLAKRFHEEWDRVLPAQFAQPPMPGVTAEQVIDGLQEAWGRQHDLKPGKEDDKAYQALLRLGPVLEELRDAQEALTSAQTPDDRLVAEEQIIRLLAFNGKLAVGSRTGQKGNWEGEALTAIRDASDAAAEARTELVSGLRAACLGPLLRVVQTFVREYRDERVTQGTLEFHDLLILTRDLLAQAPAVRRDLARRYQTLLIDEFQDTDPIQIEIAVLIASDDADAGRKPWDEVHVEPGRLFFVGDPKQSIYRFRRADIDLYRTAAARFGAEPAGEMVALVQNFRSVPSVIAWVNHVFGELFGLGRKQPETGAVEQVPFAPLEASRQKDDTVAVSVHLLGGPLSAESSNADGLRVVEARGIAALVATIRADGECAGRWRVWDEGAKDWRAPQFKDIAILMPTRTALPALEQALNEGGIPCRIESRSLLFETQEVRDLLTILAAIDDPTDQVAVVAALRAPGFGCSDQDLYRFVAARGSWDYRRAAPEGFPADDIVVQSMAALKELNEKRWWIDTAEMVDLVIRNRRLFQVGFATRRPRELWQRLRFVHEQARAFDRAGGRSLRQFVQFMERQGEEQARVTETAIAEDDDDAVRIMTVHASKGLEFPIVILTGLNVQPLSDSPPVLWSEQRQPEVRLGSDKTGYFETDGYEHVKSREAAMERFERDRLLYVAATRARDHLVANVFHLAPRSPKPHAERHASNQCRAAECVYAICEERPELWRPAVAPANVAPLPAVSLPPGTDTAAARDAWQAEREALIAKNTRMNVLSATRIAKAAGAEFEAGEVKDEQDDDEAPWRRGRAGTSIGRAVHAVLQTIDLATGAGLEATARAQATAEGVTDREAEVRELAQSALDSVAVREAVAGGRYWREVYVAAPVGEARVEGFIDLLYEGPDGLVVVDYKTDAVRTDAEIDAALGRYRLQGAAYALALSETLGRPVTRCVFVFVRRGKDAEEREIEDLAAAMDEIRARIPEMASL